MAAFLFARALYRTEEFSLASNVDGAGAFDDLVFRYRLRESDVWKTCFIQLKHKKNGGTIQRSSLIQMSGDFSLFKYFMSFCVIKKKAATDRNLKQCGPFIDFEFVIYTNAKIENKSTLQGGDSDPLSILSSGTDYGKYIAFDKDNDKDIFGFFEDLSRYHKLFIELDSLLKNGGEVNKGIKETITKILNLKPNNEILGKLNTLKSTVKTENTTKWIEELATCDFTLFEEFLSKVKIFPCQSNEESFKELIENELQDACKASPSVANTLYPEYEDGFSNWWRSDGDVEWFNENSEPCQRLQKKITSRISKISEREIKEIVECSRCFSQRHVQKLSDDIKQSTVLNVVTNSDSHSLQKKKIYHALNNLGYKNSLFISVNYLIDLPTLIKEFWPSKWSEILVVDCGYDFNTAHTMLEILQEPADCGKRLDNSDENKAETLIDIIQKYQQKVVLISPGINISGFQKKLRIIYREFEDNCNIKD